MNWDACRYGQGQGCRTCLARVAAREPFTALVPLTEQEIEQMRAEHTEHDDHQRPGGWACNGCYDAGWPCRTLRLIATLDMVTAERDDLEVRLVGTEKRLDAFDRWANPPLVPGAAWPVGDS